MADQIFHVAYPGELTSADEEAFDRDGFTVFQNAVGVADPFWEKPGAQGDAGVYQVVRVEADDAEEARRKVVAALGREPDGLEIGT